MNTAMKIVGGIFVMAASAWAMLAPKAEVVISGDGVLLWFLLLAIWFLLAGQDRNS